MELAEVDQCCEVTVEPGIRQSDTPPKKPLVVLVGADSATIDRARLLGIEVFLVQLPQRVDVDSLKQVYGATIADYTAPLDLSGHMVALRDTHDIRGAISFTELGLLTAAQLNEQLGTPGASAASVAITRDKAAMRNALRAVQPLPASIVNSVEAASTFGDEHGWPFILKPVKGFGSMRVVRIDTPEQLNAVDWTDGELLAEQFVCGRLISVDAYSRAGCHTAYAFNEEFPIGGHGPAGANPHVEVAHQLPAAISAEETTRLEGLVKQFLDVLGITEGCSHSEFILSADGPVMIECHTRPGGDFIPEMFQRCTGIDLLSLGLGCCAGLAEPPAPPLTWTKGAALCFFTPPAGTVRRICGAEACMDMPGVAAIHLSIKPGDTIKPLLYCGDRVGYVMAISDTSANAMAICRDVIERVQIEVDVVD
jgi:biotin carboxylase